MVDSNNNTGQGQAAGQGAGQGAQGQPNPAPNPMLQQLQQLVNHGHERHPAKAVAGRT